MKVKVIVFWYDDKEDVGSRLKKDVAIRESQLLWPKTMWGILALRIAKAYKVEGRSKFKIIIKNTEHSVLFTEKDLAQCRELFVDATAYIGYHQDITF